MNAVSQPVFPGGTDRVITMVREAGRPPAPPPFLIPAPARRPAVPSGIMALLQRYHRAHLTSARFWHAPPDGDIAITPDAGAQGRYMAQAAEIRRLLSDAGEAEAAARMEQAEANTRASFGASP